MKIYAELRLTADSLDPDDITMRAGVSPTKAWRNGEPIMGSSTGKRTFSRWAIHTETLDTYDSSDAICLLMKRTSSILAKNLALLAAEYSASFEVSCAIYRSGGDPLPSLFMNRNVIGWLSSIGAALDIDIIETA